MKFNPTIINPFTSLFGKIFLWFWLTVIIMLVSAFFIGKLVNDSNRISLAEASVTQRHAKSIEQLQSAVARGVPIKKAIRRSTSRRYPLSIIVDPDREKIVATFPEPLLTAANIRYRRRIIQLSTSHDVLVIRSSPIEFIGPFQVTGEDAEYAVFKARILRRDEQISKHFLPVLVLMLVVGTLLCGALAWRLTKPLKQLKQATQRISQGELETQLEGYENRRDEIGQLARDFNQMSTKLAYSIEQQQRLMANISHELRTPLTRLHLASAMLAENKHPENTEINVQRIENEIEIMDNLIGQAIDLARMSLGELSNANKRPLENCALRDEINKLQTSMTLEVEALIKELKVVQVPDIQLMIHVQTFSSCLENIVRNALRFAKTCVQIEFEIIDERLCIFVSDDGIGATEQEFAEFLKPFNYAREPEQEHHSYGLGLAIAEAGIKMHDGDIQWASSRLSGLTVKITIPIHES